MRSHNQVPYTQDGTMRWFIGMVESRNDPLQMGRVQVRIIGYHTDDKDLIPTEKLPWASPLNPINSASVSGVGTSPTGMMEGTMIAGFWGDYPDCQIPIVLGTFNLQEGFGGGLGGGLFNPYDNLIGDNSDIGPGTISPTGDGPKWLQIARGELQKGVREWPGARHNPEVMKYGKEVGFTTDDKNHPWCAAFVRWCLKKSGVSVSGLTGAAKSVSKSPAFERIQQPLYGCVATKNRSSPNAKPWQGHVGFWVGRKGGSDLYLGGNQGNKVSIAPQRTRHHHGYWWPKGQPKSLANNTGGGADNTPTQTGTVTEQ